MAKVIDQDTKYYGEVGIIDHKNIRDRGGYVEIPVLIKFDNDFSQTIIFTNDQIEGFM